MTQGTGSLVSGLTFVATLGGLLCGGRTLEGIQSLWARSGSTA